MFIRTIADLSDPDIRSILARADEYRLGLANPPDIAGAVVGLVFLDASLRTRVGFACAAARLGATPISVMQRRANEVSAAESTFDTLRTVCGYCDVVVARLAEPFEALPRGATAHVINGGDRGPRQEHPSQALIDLFALTRNAKPIAEMVIVLAGDLRMRSARSLLAILERFPPKRLVIATLPALEVGFELPSGLAGLVEYRGILDLHDADVLYMVGIPDGAITDEGRSNLRLSERVLKTLSPNAIILSPMPLIDEVQHAVRDDVRMQFYRQSDEAMFVRMSLLEYVISS